MAFDAGEESGPDVPKCIFTEGDLVRLRSGPLLTVSSVMDNFIIEVNWFDGAVMREATLPDWCFFPEATLKGSEE